MPSETRKFSKVKDHKHTVSFEEAKLPGKPPIVGTLYVQSWFVGDAEEITVTVNTDKSGGVK